jgi:hypothetical protein
MKRRVIFGDVAEEEFGKVATRIPVVELHLDVQKSDDMKRTKEEVVSRQKKKNRRKKKGLNAFMENDSEKTDFKADAPKVDKVEQKPAPKIEEIGDEAEAEAAEETGDIDWEGLD